MNANAMFIIIINFVIFSNVNVNQQKVYGSLIEEASHHSTNHTSIIKLSEAKFCPTEYKHGTIYAEAGNVERFEVGHSVKITCNPDHPSWKFTYASNKKSFFTYPNSTIQCMFGGIWSLWPICVAEHIKFSNVTEPPTSLSICNNVSRDVTKSCPQDWNSRNVEDVPGECQPIRRAAGEANVKTKHVFFNFPQQFYFGFIIVSLPLKIHGVRVLVEKNAILPEAATKLPKDFYTRWKMINTRITRSESFCSVVLAVYTDKLAIEISTTDNEPLDQSSVSSGILFYPIREEAKQTQATNQATLGCPKPPIIPNAIKFSITEEPNTYLYVCNEGYLMYDPINKSLSDGKLICIESKWSPHPFPVCRRIISYYETEGESSKMTQNSVYSNHYSDCLLSIASAGATLVIITVLCTITYLFFISFREPSNQCYADEIKASSYSSPYEELH